MDESVTSAQTLVHVVVEQLEEQVGARLAHAAHEQIANCAADGRRVAAAVAPQLHVLVERLEWNGRIDGPVVDARQAERLEYLV